MARAELTGRAVEGSEILEHRCGRFMNCADPDANEWSVQEAPGRVAGPMCDHALRAERSEPEGATVETNEIVIEVFRRVAGGGPNPGLA